MTPSQIDAARRVAETFGGDLWMPGMLAYRPDCPPWRVVHIEDAGNALQENGWIPALNDHATRGCLLARSREAWDDALLTCIGQWNPRSGTTWRVVAGKQPGTEFLRHVAGKRYASEGEAIAASYLAAYTTARYGPPGS